MVTKEVYFYWDGEKPIPISFESKEISKKWNIFCFNGMIGRRTDEPLFPQYSDYILFIESIK